MWFVLGLAAGSLMAAAVFVARADLRKLALGRSLTWATLLAVASGLCANFAAVMSYAAQNERPDLHLVVMQGLAEAVTPGILGLTMLSISWLLVAVGTRRVQDRAE